MKFCQRSVLIWCLWLLPSPVIADVAPLSWEDIVSMAQGGVAVEVTLSAAKARGLVGEPSIDIVVALSAKYGPKAVDELIAIGPTTSFQGMKSTDALVELCSAIGRRDLAAVHSALKASPDLNAICVGSRPLHLAVQTGSLDVVQALVESGAMINNPDSAGSVALDFATASAGPFTKIPESGGFNGFPEVRHYLIGLGAQLSERGVESKKMSDKFQALEDSWESMRIRREQELRQAKVDASRNQERIQHNVAMLSGLVGAIASSKNSSEKYSEPISTVPFSRAGSSARNSIGGSNVSTGIPSIEAFKGSITLCSQADGACMGGAQFFDYVHVTAGTVEARILPHERDSNSFSYTVQFSNRTKCQANVGSTIMQHGDTLNVQTLDMGNIELDPGQIRESSSRRFSLSRSQSERGIPVEFRFNGTVYGCK